MAYDHKIVKPGVNGLLISAKGKQLSPPEGWAFLAAGDAGLTRKVTAACSCWRVQVPMGRRLISKGIWAPEAIISQARQEVTAVRLTAGYQNKLAADRLRRVKKQAVYEEDFYQAVRTFLAFAPRHKEAEQAMAAAISAHAVPVGSGTVARTTMIPLAERAAKAVIAWMRHQTTAYDSMSIPRIKGQRRELRRMLAERSTMLLKAYRQDLATSPDCPLQKALNQAKAAARL